MNAELIAVGTELLMGQIANTDGQYLTDRLSSLGVNVHFHTVVGDNDARLGEVLRLAFSRSDCVILTGGLGPTYDDMTKETVAAAFGLPLVEDAEAMRRLEDYFTKRGRIMTPSNRKQAMLPQGAMPLYNNWGTAPGVLIEQDGKIAVMLPGPPREMQPMFETYVAPYLKKKSGASVVSEYIHLFGIGEAEAEKRVSDLTASANPTIAPYVSTGEMLFRLSARAENDEAAKAMIAPLKKELYARFGDTIYGEGRDMSLPQCVLQLLSQKGYTLAIAESCTGGMVSSAITDLPGASSVFLYGAVTYANEAKVRALAVSEETLARVGAVSEETALQMARGVRLTAKSDIGVSTTGIAGPGGGSAEKPVGTVYIAISTEKKETACRLFLSGGRDRVRSATVLHVYDLIRRTIKEELV